MSTDLDTALADIAAGKRKPIYVVVGEEFLARKTATALVDALVPPAAQALNLTVMESGSAAEVARDLATVGMFRSDKVVWLREPEFLLPKKGRTDALAKVRDAWNANRRKDAARRLLALGARAGWGLSELDPGSPTAAPPEAWKEELDLELSDPDLTFLRELCGFCRAEGISAPDGDGRALETLVEQGMPKGHHLVIEASQLDTRSGLTKRLLAAGLLLERKVERDLRKLDIHEVVAQSLAPFQKRLGRDAEALLKSLVGGNMRLLGGELEKLALYVGERPTIELEDVRLLVRRAREEEYTELADAVQKRDLKAALQYVDDALEQGQQGLMILGALAGLFRRLLDDHERYRRMRLPGRVDYRSFQSDVMPLLMEEAKTTGRKVPHAYVCFLGWQGQQRYRREELLALVLACGEADLALKSSASSRLVLQRLLLRVAIG